MKHRYIYASMNTLYFCQSKNTIPYMRTTQMYSRDVNTLSDIIPLEIESTNTCLFLPCVWINIGMFSMWHDGQWRDMSRQCRFVFVTSLWSEYCGIVVDWSACCESGMLRDLKGHCCEIICLAVVMN